MGAERGRGQWLEGDRGEKPCATNLPDARMQIKSPVVGVALLT